VANDPTGGLTSVGLDPAESGSRLGGRARALESRVVLCEDRDGVRAGEIGTVVGYYATRGEVDHAVSFPLVDALLRLPVDAIEPVAES
jgi:hypothetical protein